jgi:hypothetical protein
MLVTTELRWFAAGPLPDALNTWFEKSAWGSYAQSQPSSETRTDRYLCLPCEFLNVKFRQGKLEAKWRQAVVETLILPQGSQGQLERWVKWSDQVVAEEDWLSQAIADSGDWVEVHKVRSQRFFSVDPESNQVTMSDQPPHNGCSAELTELEVQQQAWWSLAFEAVGQIPQPQTLKRIACNFLEHGPQELRLEALQLSQSYAYPRWLMTVLSNA